MHSKLIFLLCILNAGCIISSRTAEEIPVFYFEKTSCYGECPVYKLEISNSGKMLFLGVKNTKFTGRYCSQIALGDLEMLKSEFRNKIFFSFQDAYLSRSKDLPTTITSFYVEGKQKRVVDYENAPEGLKRLEKLLETIADTTSWRLCKQ